MKWWTKLEATKKRFPIICKVIHQISRSHGIKKIADFDPNWAFPDCNSSLNSLMALKWYIKLNVALKRCPIIFQGHPSNFKVTRDKKSSILTRVERFRTVTQVLIHPGVWEDAQSLMKINDLNPIWVRLLGRSQLSNPSDLPCCNSKMGSHLFSCPQAVTRNSVELLPIDPFGTNLIKILMKM